MLTLLVAAVNPTSKAWQVATGFLACPELQSSVPPVPCPCSPSEESRCLSIPSPTSRQRFARAICCNRLNWKKSPANCRAVFPSRAPWPANLQVLVCAGSKGKQGKLADLSPLKGMKLTFLNCYFTRVADLSPLHGMPLKQLHCAFTSVADLAPLRGMDLLVLNINNNRDITDLAPLRGMPLTVLHCAGTKITDLSPLQNAPLRALQCPIPATNDHTTLRSLKQLKQINRRSIADFWKAVAEPMQNAECRMQNEKDGVHSAFCILHWVRHSAGSSRNVDCAEEIGVSLAGASGR